jgi:hypothetical protein
MAHGATAAPASLARPSTGDHSDGAQTPGPTRQGLALGAAAAPASPAILAQATTVPRAAASNGAERLYRRDGLAVSFRERMSGLLPAAALLHTMHGSTGDAALLLL